MSAISTAVAATAMIAAPLTGAHASAQCHRDGAYDAAEIAGSTFFTMREQTKFAPGERHYPLAQHATARYCFSRGCMGQLTVRWTEDEQHRLRALRATVVEDDDGPASELRFIKIAVLQMESWLYARLRSLDAATVSNIMNRTAAYSSQAGSDTAGWVTGALSSFDRFNKECATYAMEATQHLLVLANLGLLRHWNITAPVYRFGLPGHWTAGLENRRTCERYRFDLNSRASARYDLHVRGRDPAMLTLEDSRSYSHLFPGIDGNGRGRPTGRRPPDAPSGGFALGGPRPAVSAPR